MKRVLIIFSVSLIAVLVSCDKETEGNLIIQGNVSDSRNGAAVGNAEVTLKQQLLEGGSFNSTFVTAVQSNTASSGNYELEFDRENAAAYRIELEKEGYFPKRYDVNPDNIRPGDPYTRNGTLTSRATFHLRLFNDMPFDNNDRVRFRHLNANFDDCPCCNNDFIVLEGADADSIFTCDLHGDFQIKYVWEVTKNDTTITYVDSLFCPAFIETGLEIGY